MVTVTQSVSRPIWRRRRPSPPTNCIDKGEKTRGGWSAGQNPFCQGHLARGTSLFFTTRAYAHRQSGLRSPIRKAKCSIRARLAQARASLHQRERRPRGRAVLILPPPRLAVLRYPSSATGFDDPQLLGGQSVNRGKKI